MPLNSYINYTSSFKHICLVNKDKQVLKNHSSKFPFNKKAKEFNEIKMHAEHQEIYS